MRFFNKKLVKRSFCLFLVSFFAFASVSVFFSVSASAASDSSLTPANVLSFYDFRPYKVTETFKNLVSNNNLSYKTMNTSFPSDSSTSSVTRTDDSTIVSFSSFGIPTSSNPFNYLSCSLSHFQPLTGSAGFYIDEHYCNQDYLFEYLFTYHITGGGSIRSRGSVSNVGCRFLLSNGTWISSTYDSSRLVLGTSSTFEYEVVLSINFPSSSAGLYVVGFMTLSNFNFNVDISAPPVYSYTLSYELSDITFPDLSLYSTILDGSKDALMESGALFSSELEEGFMPGFLSASDTHQSIEEFAADYLGNALSSIIYNLSDAFSNMSISVPQTNAFRSLISYVFNKPVFSGLLILSFVVGLFPFILSIVKDGLSK